LPGVHEFAGQDERRVTLRFTGGASAQIVVTTPVNLGAVLVQATGSDAHLEALAKHAAERGHNLSGAALWHASGFVPTPTEADLYRALGLVEIPPELREGRGEIAAAAEGMLPRLVERSDLLGFLHCHTLYSDGTNTVEELALACPTARYADVGPHPDSRLRVRRSHRPQPGGRLRRRAQGGRPDASGGRDRRGERGAVHPPGAQGRRGRHPGRRSDRLRRGRAPPARFRDRVDPHPV